MSAARFRLKCFSALNTVLGLVPYGMKQEADVGLHQQHHSVDVHDGLLVPAAQIGPDLRLQILHLTQGETINSLETPTCCNIFLPYYRCVSYLGRQAALETLDVFIQLDSER